VFLIIKNIGDDPNRKRFIFLGLILCLQVLAGHPQYLLYTLFFAWLYLLFVTRHLLRRDQIRSWIYTNAGFFFSICIAGLIALPQIVPVYEMLSLSPRKTMEISDVAWFSLPLANLLTFFTPSIFGDGVKFPYWGFYNLWEMCAYCGTMSLLLSALAIRNLKKANHVIYFFFLSVFALLIAIGDRTPLLELLYHIFPGFKMFRGHSKTIIFCCFAIAIMAGTGYDALRISALRKRRRLFLLLLGGLTLLFVLLMMSPYPAMMEDPIKSFVTYVQSDPRSYLPVPGAETTEFAGGAVKQALMSVRYFLICFFLGIVLILFAFRLESHRLLNAIIILFLLGDLFIFGKSFVSSVDVHHWALKPEARQFLAGDKDQYRSAVITSFGSKYGITSNLHQIVGDYPYVLSRYSRLYNLANRGKPTASMKISSIRRISPVYNLLNLKYLVINSDRHFDIPGYSEVYNDGVLAILENRYVKKRVYFPRSIKIVENEKEALRGVFELPSIRGDQTIIERDGTAGLSFEYGSPSPRENRDGMVEIVEYSPNRIRLRTDLSSDAWIILTDTYYPGWKATIDGKAEAPIVPANYIFRAIHVTEGRHEIVFRYWPTHLTLSIAVALITLLGCCVLAIFPRKEHGH
jgi:hypothetical protein